jgi:hypothetical protein
LSMTPPPHLPGSYLVMELTNRCNLACVHCAVSEEGHPHHRKTGFLDPVLAHAVFQDLAKLGAKMDSLVLFWLGEPLLHPHFMDIYLNALRHAVSDGIFGKLEVHTNAVLLSTGTARGMLNNAPIPQAVHFSLDAVSAQTYLRIKGRDKLEAAARNAGRFLDEKAASGATWPRPVFQFIVGSNNAEEAAAFKETWETACKDRSIPVRSAAGHVPQGRDAVVFFRQLDCPTAAEQERENAVFKETMAALGLATPKQRDQTVVKAENLKPCSGFWKSPVIDWTGNVTVCTRDNGLENCIGNLRTSSFGSLWWGERLAARRERVARGDYGGLDLCSTCFIPRSLNHSLLSLEDIGRQSDYDNGLQP